MKQFDIVCFDIHESDSIIDNVIIGLKPFIMQNKTNKTQHYVDIHDIYIYIYIYVCVSVYKRIHSTVVVQLFMILFQNLS